MITHQPFGFTWSKVWHMSDDLKQRIMYKSYDSIYNIYPKQSLTNLMVIDNWETARISYHLD